MNYQDYDVEDFVMDLSFQNYCSGTNEEDVIYWKSWIIANPSCQEKAQQAARLYILLNGNNNAQQFRRHQDAFKKALHQHLHPPVEVAQKLSAASIITTVQKRSKRHIVFLYVGSIAASLILIVIVFYFRNSRQQAKLNENRLAAEATYTSRPGERKSLQLPDGSVVLLNSGTTINFSPGFNVAGREVFLNGEAYFKVTHNAQKPFIIHTKYINVKVLGTEFNVKAYREDKTTETTLIRGSVEVTLKDKYREKIILKPNHKVVIQNNLAPTRASPDSTTHTRPKIPEEIKMMDVMINAKDSTVMETSWIENRLNFNDESLAEVAIKLERWYGVKISVEEDIAYKYKYTGIFENESIKEALKALQSSLFFHYKVEDDKIIITK